MPVHLRDNLNVMRIMDIAHGRRIHRYTRKRAIEHRVRQCEQHLRDLREELLAAEADVEEVDRDMSILRNFFEQHPPLDEGSNSQSQSVQVTSPAGPYYSGSSCESESGSSSESGTNKSLS